MLFFLIIIIDTYKKTFVIEYMKNSSMQRLFSIKKEFISLVLFLLKRNIQWIPELLVIYIISFLLVIKMEVFYLPLFICMLVFTIIMRFFNHILKNLALIIILIINIIYLYKYTWLQHVITILIMLSAYLTAYYKIIVIKIPKIKFSNYLLKIFICIFLVYLIDYVQYYVLHLKNNILLFNVLVLSTYLLFDFDCEVVYKQQHNNFFNMYKLAFVFKNKQILLNWKKIKTIKLVNIVSFAWIFSDIFLLKFNLTFFFVKCYLFLNTCILYYFSMDIFVRGLILQKSFVYNNKFLLYIIKGWIYLPVMFISVINSLFVKDKIIIMIAMGICVLVLIIVYNLYSSNWKNNE